MPGNDQLNASSLAQRMRDARESRGATLADVEKATRIRWRYLEAIETGNWGELPDGPPSRGFIHIYARYLGMDADQCVEEFETTTGNIALVMRDEYIPPPPARERPQSARLQRARLEAQNTPRPPKYRAALPPPEAAELDAMADAPAGSTSLPPNERVYRSLDEIDAEPEPAEVETRGPNGNRSREDMVSSFSLKGTPVITRINPSATLGSRAPRATRAGLPARPIGMIAAGAVLVLGLALIAFVGLPALTRLLNTAAPTATAVAILRPTSGVTDATPIFAATPGPIPTSPVAASSTPTTTRPALRFAPRAGGGMQFTLDARERAWARVTVDGALVFEGITPIGPALAWTAARGLTLETGNAGAFDAIVNGERLGPLGARNTIVRRTWDAAGTIKDE
ncbi:MAG: RodZ domain-containing protein [Thermoflexales bacterium]